MTPTEIFEYKQKWMSSDDIIHIWSDCLNENSVFTCMRMLNK